ncbi:MAG: hypothetical protein R6W70_10610 [bacterium]
MWLNKKLIFILIISLTSLLSALSINIGMPYGKHNIGHTTITVNTQDQHKKVIYDFGRYGRTWGYLNFSGEGIMRVWRGEKSVDYFKAKQKRFRTTIAFKIKTTPEQERKAYEYFESLIKEGKLISTHKHYKKYRLKMNFDGVTIQCTSMSLNGLRKAFSEKDYKSLLPEKFNKGKGFTKKQRNYFFKVQKKHKVNDVVVPKDVLAALNNALKEEHPLVLKKEIWKRR